MTIPLSKATLLRQSFSVGDRVKAQPWTDRFMMGDVYGSVVKVGRKHINVHMDHSQRVVKFHPTRIEHVS